MKKTILLTCFAIIFISFIKCSINRGIHERSCDKQKDFKVKGILLDGETGDPLPGGIIYLLDKKHNSEIKFKDNEAGEYIHGKYVALDAIQQDLSDLDGVYQIKNIPEGEYFIIHRMCGYRSSVNDYGLTAIASLPLVSDFARPALQDSLHLRPYERSITSVE